MPGRQPSRYDEPVSRQWPTVRYMLKAACLKGRGFTESRVFLWLGRQGRRSEQISQRS